MGLSIYNTLSKSKEPLKPLEDNHVRLYVCGMTVYDYCHIGHARVMVAFDEVARWLRFRGYKLTYVRTITDIDDTGVLARPLQHARALGGQGLEPFFRAFIGTMLVPHGREDAEFGKGRLAPDQVEYLLVFVGLETVIGDEFGGDFDVVAKSHFSQPSLRNQRLSSAGRRKGPCRPRRHGPVR